MFAVFVLVLFLFGGLVVKVVDDGGLDASEALETPGDVNELFDEFFFDEADGAEFEDEFGVVLGELFGVFAGDEWFFGTEAVFDGIVRSSLLAFFGAWTG